MSDSSKSSRSSSSDSEQAEEEQKEEEEQKDENSVEQDSNERIHNIFHITTPHDSRVISSESESEEESKLSSSSSSVEQLPEAKLEPQNEKENEKSDTSQAPQQNEEEDSAELEQAERNLLKHKKAPPAHLRGKLLQKLKSDTVDCLIAQDYDRAAALEAAANFLMEQYECEMVQKMKDEEGETVIQRLGTARENLKREEARWVKIMDVFKSEQVRDRRALADKHADEMKEFEEQWGNPANLIQYNKPSSQLLFLRKQQKRLALAKQFQEAKRVKLNADKLEKTETVNAEVKAITAMQLAYEKLKEKQAKEVECFKEHETRTRQYLQGERRKSIEPLELLIKQLEIAKDRNKPMNKKPQPVVFKSNRRTRTLRTEKALPPTSPRTARALCDFKVADEPNRLFISGLNVRQIVSGRRPVSASRLVRSGRR